MLIRILYTDGRYDMVKPFFLDWLITSGRITMFTRNGTWAHIGRDPLRRQDTGPSHGDDRRHSSPPPPLALLAALLSQGQGTTSNSLRK